MSVENKYMYTCTHRKIMKEIAHYILNLNYQFVTCNLVVPLLLFLKKRELNNYTY